MAAHPASIDETFANHQAQTDASVGEISHAVRQLMTTNSGTAEIAPIAAAYFRLCRDVNQRLRTAVEWTRRGLFVEARHLVEQAPDALTAATKLDLSDQWTRWTEVCTQAGVPIDAPVTTAFAVELSRAYSEWASREALLNQLRLEALARHPLRQRLATLYQLRAANSDNANWTDQIKDLEAARAREMVKDADTARRAGDIAALRALMKEAQNGPWQAGVPHSAVNSVISAVSKAVGLSSTKRLHELVQQMHRAHGNADDHAVGELLAEWRAIIAAREAQPTPEDAAEAEPIAAWWDARHADAKRLELAQRLCAELDTALADQHPWQEIANIHRSLEDTQVPIPPALTRRFNVRAEEHRHAVAARHRRITIVTSLLLLVAAGGVAWGVSIYMRSRQTDSFRSGLEAALAADDLSAAKALADQVRGLSSGISSSASLAPVLAKFDEAWRVAIQNDESLAAVLSQLATAKGADGDHEALIAQAHKLSRTVEQKAEFERQTTRIATERKEFLEAADNKLMDAVEGLVAKCEASLRTIDESLKPNAPPPPQIRQDLDIAFVQLDKLESLIKEHPASESKRGQLTVQASVLRRRATEFRETLDREALRLAKLEKLGAFQGRLSELASAYKEFLSEFSDGPVAERLTAVSMDAPAWSALDVWLTGYDTWSATWDPPSDAEAAARATEVETLLRSMGAGFDASTGREYDTYLNRMKTLLSNPRDATAVTAWYEALQKPRLLELEVVYDINGKPRRTIGGVLTPMNDEGWYQLVPEIDSFEKFDNKKEPLAGIVQFKEKVNPATALRPAPEAELAKRMIEALDACEKGNASWSTLNLQLAILIQSATEADPIFRANFLCYAINRQSNAGWPFEGELTSAKAIVEKLQSAASLPASQDWFASSAQTLAARHACTAAFKSVPDLTGLAKASSQRLLDMKAKLRPPQFAGLVWAKADGPAEYQGKPLTGSVVVASLGQDDRANLREAGWMTGGVVKWNGPIPPVGTPILVRN